MKKSIKIIVLCVAALSLGSCNAIKSLHSEYQSEATIPAYVFGVNVSLSGDSSDFVNFPIDTPFTINDLSQRDFFMALLEIDEYRAQYHEYLRILAEDYALGGGLDAALNNIHGQIDDLVAEDTTAFCTYEEYMATAEGLSAAIKLRAQSVLGQLKGSIPATREEQKVHPELLLDVSGADLSALTGDIGIGFKTGEGKEGFAQLFENMDDFVDSFGGSSGSPAGEDAP